MYACDIPHAIHMCKILEDLACVQNILDIQIKQQQQQFQDCSKLSLEQCQYLCKKLFSDRLVCAVIIVFSFE